jgi:hypothetical protein
MGQGNGQIGALKVQVTVFEQGQMPSLLFRLENNTDQEIWWQEGGGRTRAGSWRFSSQTQGGTLSHARGCSPASPERSPTQEELQSWSMQPGEHRMYTRGYGEKRWQANFVGSKNLPLKSWHTSFTFTLPLTEQPTMFFDSWKGTQKVSIDVDCAKQQALIYL